MKSNFQIRKAIRLVESITGKKVILKESTNLKKNDIEKVLGGYLEALIWLNEDEEGFDEVSIYDISNLSKQETIDDIKSFLSKANSLLTQVDLDDEQIGHDFFLTRNNHGAGFWDRGLGEVGEKLSDIANSFREIYAFVKGGKIIIE